MAILQSKLNVTKSNDSGLVADILRFMDMEGQVSTSALYVCLTHPDEMAPLLSRVVAVKQQGEEKIRKVMTEYWQATQSGSDLLAKHAALKAIPIKQRTQAQKEQFKLLQLSTNNMSIKLQRAVFTYEGVDALRGNGRSVMIAKVPGSKSYTCYVKADSEFEYVRFTAEQLRLVTAVDFTAATLTTDILAGCTSSGKKNTPNEDKGANGEALQGAEIAKAVTALDTTIAKHTDGEGKLAMSAANKEALHLLWARCERTMTKEEKKKALAKYDAEGTKDDAAVAVA